MFKRWMMAAIVLCSLVAPNLSAAPSTAQAARLRAGAAKIDITPDPAMFPFTGGQTYVGVHDPLYARALVLAEATGKVVLISVDATQLRLGDELIDAVAGALNIPRERVLLSATHDHNAPLAGFKDPATPAELSYFRKLKDGIVAAALAADHSLQPARIGFGTGKAYVNVNINQTRERLTGVSQGPSDKTVAVMLVSTPSGVPIAVYANYAVHANVMNASHTRDGKAEVTGDISGISATLVEEQLGNDAVALWTSGAAGDQVPAFASNSRFWSSSAPPVFDEGAAGWAVLNVQARQLADEIVRVTRDIRRTTDHTALWGTETLVSCPGQNDQTSVAIPLKLIMVGDIALTGVSGEVYTEIGEHLKAVSPFGNTMMVTNLPKAIGYILTDEAYMLPSDKKVPNLLKPGCAEPAIINELIRLMNGRIAAGNGK